MPMYPNPPSWRIPYDVDGTQCHKWSADGSYWSQFTSTDLQLMSKELSTSGYASDTGTGAQPSMYSMIFPELRDLDAMAICVYRGGNYPAMPGIPEWSSDTTNGWDGTWTSTGKSWTVGASKPYHRNNIQSVGALGIKALRWWGMYAWDGCIISVQLYGERSAGTAGKFLYVWHPTLDQRIGYTTLDYGDVARMSSGDVTFRVKNDSTFTANNIIVTTQALMDSSPSIAGQFAVSTDGSTFTAQVNIGNLSPGATSSILTLRRSFVSNAALGLWWPRIKVDAGSWT